MRKMSDNESLDDFSNGDLGLGDGLKPGGIKIDTENDARDNSEAKLIGECDNDVQDQSNESPSGFTTPEDSDDEYEICLMPIRSVQDLKQQYSAQKSIRCSETAPKAVDDSHSIYDCRYFQVRSCECQEGPDSPSHKCDKPCTCESDKLKDDSEKFPVYADVPMGTSLRQQRELFQHNIEALRKKDTNCGSGAISKQTHDRKGNQSIHLHTTRRQEEIAMKLAKTLQEVDDLRLELDTCEKRLDSKYKAIDILKHQAEEAQIQLKNSEITSRERTIKLAQEINRLQFELHWKESTILDSQQLWAERFNSGDGSRVISHVVGNEQDLGDISNLIASASSSSPSKPSQAKEGGKEKEKTVSVDKYKRVCLENTSLMDTLAGRTEELRKVTAQKMAVQRENDELLALLDIQERAKYEKTRSVSSEENYNTFSSTELAILGACRCRVSNPDPCRCAHAAAGLKKDVIRMKEEGLQFKNRRDEAFLTVDAYRKAFEEQLQRNRTLTIQLANIVSNTQTKTAKAKSAFRWLIGNFDDDDDMSEETAKPGTIMSEQEIITYLTELVNEKKEVLAHQKLASQILGDRVRHLEEKLGHYEKDSEVFT